MKVIVPCYNEADRLQPNIFLVFTQKNPTYSFCFVDDGCTDATAKVLHDMETQCPNISVFSLSKNQGKAEAVRQGVLKAMDTDCDFVSYIDADLSAPLSVLPAMRHVCEEDKQLLLVSAARVRMLGRNIRRSSIRHYLGRIFATMIAALFNLHVYDTQCGAKIFRNVPQVHKVFSTPFHSRWIFDVEIFLRLRELCLQKKMSLVQVAKEIPLPIWHDLGKSRMRWTDFFRVPNDILRIYSAYHRNPTIPQIPPSAPPPPYQNTHDSQA